MNRDLAPLPPNAPRKRPRWRSIAGYVALVLLLAWLYSHPSEIEQSNGTARPTQSKPSAVESSREQRTAIQEAEADRKARSSRGRVQESTAEPRRDRDGDATFIARDVRITNENGRVIFRGDVDVGPTLDRIDRGQRLRFSHDGIVFQNREKRLPIKPSGYYREFIHPTKGEGGPGGQRVVIGRDGEAYYSPDHYRTFQRVR